MTGKTGRTNRQDQPDHRTRGRRGHAHALFIAEGPASRGQPIAVGACAQRRPQGARRCAGRGDRPQPSIRRRTRSPACARTLKPLSSASVSAPRMRYWRRGDAIAPGADDLLVAFGDTPLISAETFEHLRAPLKKGAALAVVGFSRRRPDWLWPAARRGRPVDGDPRAGRCQR